MEMKDLYSFSSRFLTRSFQASPIGLGHDDQGECYEHNLIKSKFEGVNFPVVFKKTGGTNFTDVLATGWVSLFLISDRLRNLLVENNITGWKAYPIILKDKKGNHIEGYHGFSVTGISGPTTYTNSPIFETRYVPTGPIVRLYKGATIDLSKWDGSDFFVPEYSIGIVITKKVAQLLEKNKISNLNLGCVAESEFSVDIWDSLEERRQLAIDELPDSSVKPKMKRHDFYSFSSRCLKSNFQVSVAGLGFDDNSVCHEHKLIQSKYEGINFPVLFKKKSGKRLTDILTTSWKTFCLISDRLRNLLIENNLTGWKTYPILIEDKKGNQIEGYHGFSVSGTSGPKTFSNSPILETRLVPEGPIVKTYSGATIDLSTWDESDFFIPEGSVEIIITRKVTELLNENKITNVNLEWLVNSSIEVETWDRREQKRLSDINIKREKVFFLPQEREGIVLTKKVTELLKGNKISNFTLSKWNGRDLIIIKSATKSGAIKKITELSEKNEISILSGE